MIDLNSYALSRWVCQDEVPGAYTSEDLIRSVTFKVPHPTKEDHYFLVTAHELVDDDHLFIALRPPGTIFDEPNDGDLDFVAKVFFSPSELPNLHHSMGTEGDEWIAMMELYGDDRETPIKLN